jgi:hypothetical protein
LPDSVAGKATTTSDGIDVVDELLDRRRFGSDVVVAPEPESSESSESSSSVVGGATGGIELVGVIPTTVVELAVVGGTLDRGRSRRGTDVRGTSVDSVSFSCESPPDASSGLELRAIGAIKMAKVGST